jgi:hypothetical protein
MDGRGSVVVSGYKPEGRGSFPMGSLDFSMYLFFPASLWPWDEINL